VRSLRLHLLVAMTLRATTDSLSELRFAAAR